MTETPRALHVLEFGLRWPPDTFLAAKLEALGARGYELTVACADDAAPVDGPGGVRLERVIPTGRTRALGLARALIALALRRPGRIRAVAGAARAPTADGRRVTTRETLGRLRAYARLACLRPDVVHFEWPTAAVHFTSLVDALGCPSVVSVRGGDLEVHPYVPSTSRLAAGFPVVFRRAARVHCVSEPARVEALAQGIDATKIRIIRPAVDPSFFTPAVHRNSEPGVFRVAAAGWLHWRKGWEYALQAIAAVAQAGVPVTLDLVGPDPSAEMASAGDRERIVQTIDDLGLTDRVTVHGPLRHEELRELLRAADAFLHASLAEGIPNVLLEAMACAVPVVATDVGGTYEIVTQGVEGFLVAPREPRTAAEALGSLYRDPVRREEMGRAGRARAETMTLARQADRWAELYEETIAATSSTGLRLAEVGIAWPGETYLRRKLEGLAARGVRVKVASTLGGKPRSGPGIDVVPLPNWAESPFRSFVGGAADALLVLATQPRRLLALVRAWRTENAKFADGRSRVALARLHLRLARLRADVAHFEWASFARVCAPLLRAWDFPVVVSGLGSDVLVSPRLRGHDFESLLDRVAAIQYSSSAVERSAQELGLSGAQAEVIPSAVDPDVFRPRRVRRNDGRFIVVTVGALRWVKGYEYALSAIRRLLDQDIPVVYDVVGSEPPEQQGERPRLVATVHELGLDDHVRVHGQLDEHDVVARLQEADVFLQASVSEGMPTAVVEAMACGLPVVATDVGGTAECFSDCGEGILVPARDPRALADALAELWREPLRRQALGEAARVRVVSEFTLERQLDRFQAFYERIAQT